MEMNYVSGSNHSDLDDNCKLSSQSARYPGDLLRRLDGHLMGGKYWQHRTVCSDSILHTSWSGSILGSNICFQKQDKWQSKVLDCIARVGYRVLIRVMECLSFPLNLAFLAGGFKEAWVLDMRVSPRRIPCRAWEQGQLCWTWGSGCR